MQIRNRRKIEKSNDKVADSVFTEFFNMFFGDIDNNIKDKKNSKKEKNPIKGENIETSLDIEIEESFYGLDKKISMRTIDGNVKNIKITIPEGIKNGESIRLIGQGKEGVTYSKYSKGTEINKEEKQEEIKDSETKKKEYNKEELENWIIIASMYVLPVLRLLSFRAMKWLMILIFIPEPGMTAPWMPEAVMYIFQNLTLTLLRQRSAIHP